MKLLLDTHALLWWLAGDAKVGPPARSLIADPANDVLVSAASLWEIQVKVRIGKLKADLQDIVTEMRNQALDLLEIAPRHLVALGALPRHHSDPWDHLLIAQANVEGAVFMSQDGHTPSYPVTYMTCSGSACPMIGGASIA
ncbi:type II toxin-antitoxin system VapC family toxin [Lichenicoccus sp.]|uniref:type II toxin-antitoxin system VapC family toxin n=1 Tax=Lichenicoccus sp. TaxID=2781899 RepID=UPI003D09806B